MAHVVKCLYCGESFDRDKEPCEKIGRRYAHIKCIQTQDDAILQEEKDKNQFYEVVKEIYGKDYNFMMINKQATSYIKEFGYTWSGMTKCLNWFYKINHGSLEEGHGGVGIIPYIYNDVYKYYYDIYQSQEKNKGKEMRAQVINFNIQSPRVWHRPPHLLDLEEEDNV